MQCEGCASRTTTVVELLSGAIEGVIAGVCGLGGADPLERTRRLVEAARLVDGMSGDTYNCEPVYLEWVQVLVGDEGKKLREAARQLATGPDFDVHDLLHEVVAGLKKVTECRSHPCWIEDKQRRGSWSLVQTLDPSDVFTVETVKMAGRDDTEWVRFAAYDLIPAADIPS